MNNIVSIFLLFILNPIISLVSAFKFNNLGGIKFVFLLFFFFIGYTFYIDRHSGSDIVRVVDMFKHYYTVSFQSSGKNIFQYFVFDENKAWEFVLPVICKIVSIFTGNSQIFIALISLLYGYFFTDIFIFIYQSLSGIEKSLKAIILLLFVFTISPYSFQAFRFWTAAIIFIWTVIGVFFIDKPNRLFVMFIFCFLHNALFLPFFLILFKKFNQLSVKYLFNFYIFSFVFVVFSIKIDSFLAGIMPSFLSDRGAVYVAEDYSTGTPDSAWFLVFSRTLIKYFVFFFNYFNYKNFYSKIELSPLEHSFLRFFLFFFALSNIVSSTEAYRYSIICNDLTFIIFAGFYFKFQPVDEIRKLEKNITKLARPFLIFYFVIQFRMFAEYCSVYLLAYSPLTHFFIEEQTTFFHWYSDIFK